MKIKLMIVPVPPSLQGVCLRLCTFLIVVARIVFCRLAPPKVSWIARGDLTTVLKPTPMDILNGILLTPSSRDPKFRLYGQRQSLGNLFVYVLVRFVKILLIFNRRCSFCDSLFIR